MSLPDSPLLGIADVASWLGVSESTARRYAKAGQLPAPVIAGRSVSRWRRVDLLAWAGVAE